MLRPFVIVKIQQVTPYAINGTKKERKELFAFGFSGDYEIETSWEKHTDTCKINFPKNVIVDTGFDLFRQAGTYNVILGSESQSLDDQNKILTAPPLLMRGDIVTITDGYTFYNKANTEVRVSQERFKGYISKVESDVPIKIECEDNFYLLKRVPVGISQWDGNLVSLCKKLISQTNSSLSGLGYPTLSFTDEVDELTATFSLGHLDIGDLTCSELLHKLRQQYHLESFFRGNVLHFGFPIYSSKSKSDTFFEFENNIKKEHSLEYKNKSDVVLSAVVSTKVITKTGKTTLDGEAKTKLERKSVLVYWDIVSSSFKGIVKSKGEPLPSNEGGERHEFVYPIDPSSGQPSDQTLIDYGIEHLKKYYYTGFRGSFKSIGYPFVAWGDNVNMGSRIMADRNGQYKTKKIIYRGGPKGLEQEIFLDYKVEVPEPSFTEIYML